MSNSWLPGGTGPIALSDARSRMGKQMGVRTSWRVDISCDGASPQACPTNSRFSADVHVNGSMRLAGRAGWDLTDLTLCPECSSLGTTSPCASSGYGAAEGNRHAV